MSICLTDHTVRAVTVLVGCGECSVRDDSGRTQVVIRRRKYPVVGLISMVQTVVSIEWQSAYNDDQVILIGEKDGLTITVQDLAERAESGKKRASRRTYGVRLSVLCSLP